MKNKATNGFTLVELAIALMVIGLLIGGVLKGQELVSNARVTATAKQIQAIGVAFTTFRNTYGYKPGDIINPQQRLPNCTASPCNVTGNGNGQVDVMEPSRFFPHLSKANMLSGTTDSEPTYVTNSPQPPTGNGYYIGLTTNDTNNFGGSFDPRGDILVLMALENGDDDHGVLTPAQMAQLDRKLDDGKPYTGSVRANSDGYQSGDGCLLGTTDYNENVKDAYCWGFFQLP